MNASLALSFYPGLLLLAFLIALNPSKILDRIGRILDPDLCDSYFDLGRSGSFKIQWTCSIGRATKAYRGSTALGKDFKGLQYLGCTCICYCL